MQSETSVALKLIINSHSLYESRALGMVVGSFIGDALGSFCEFESYPLPEYRINQTMQMSGGGPFNTLPGQVTDDGELAISLLLALTSTFVTNPSINPNFLEKATLSIGANYLAWFKSRPFDIGNTTANGMEMLLQLEDILEKQTSPQNQRYSILRKTILAYHKTVGSQSNGSLMRISPLAGFIAGIRPHSNPEERLILDSLIERKQSANIDDVSMTHGPVGLECARSWIYLLELIVNRPQPDTVESLKQIYETYVNSLPPGLKEWLNWAVAGDNLPFDKKSIGWMKIAWGMGVFILKELGTKEDEISLIGSGAEGRSEFYVRWMKRIFHCAGDTDTNACIVGALLGAIIGIEGLPRQYIEKILQIRFTIGMKGSQNRPTHFEPQKAIIQLFKLIENVENWKKQRISAA